MNTHQAWELISKEYHTRHVGRAERLCRQVLSQNAKHPEPLHILAGLAYQSERYDVAESFVVAALATQPEDPIYLNTYGGILILTARAHQAVGVLRKVTRLRPDYAKAWHNLGHALQSCERFAEASVAFRRALELGPESAEENLACAAALRAAGDFAATLQRCRRAVELDPESSAAHMNLAVGLLRHGQYEAGWREFEWRHSLRDHVCVHVGITTPRWDGSPLNGRRILLHPEQGFGDTIQSLRYLPFVKSRGGQVILSLQQPLLRLIRPFGHVDQLVAESPEVPPHDVQCPLMSLPLVAGTTLQNIPREIPYLYPDPTLVDLWRRRVASDPDYNPAQFKIGLAWCGNPQQPNNHNRSLPFARFSPLAEVPRAAFFSLQKGDTVPQSRDVAPGLVLHDFTQDLHDFADTAALIANLDLVITVDTSVAHLSAALGKPTWILLSALPDWRWLINRDDSPWYPTVKLFRQHNLGNWPSVIRRVTDALMVEINQRSNLYSSAPCQDSSAAL